MRSVVITGLGFVTSIGHRRAGVLAALQELRHGIECWKPAGDLEIPVAVAGTVKGFDVSSADPAGWTWPAEFELDRTVVRSLAPQGVYAVCAVGQALAEAGLHREDLSDGATGLFAASAGSPRMLKHHLERMEATGWRRGHPLGVVSSVAGTLNFNLAAHYAIRGANCGFVSACTSGGHALGTACDEIALGRQERVIVVGAEELTLETLMPFHAMGALSLNGDPDRASRPFDAARNGFVGTGGAAALIVEAEESAQRRGARIQARLRGWSQASDGWNVAAPHPEGAGLRAAMERALAAADVAEEDIDYVNAHATSTPAGDRAEALALRAVFGKNNPAISSTKALTGHGLSLAGIMEAAFCVLALDEGFIPGQASLESPLLEGAGLDFPRESRTIHPRVVLNNGSGFGGSNVCHVFSRHD